MRENLSGNLIICDVKIRCTDVRNGVWAGNEKQKDYNTLRFATYNMWFTESAIAFCVEGQPKICDFSYFEFVTKS